MSNKYMQLTIKQANNQFPDWHNKPNISITGSLKGMRKLYNWYGLVIRVGGYYYYIGN